MDNASSSSDKMLKPSNRSQSRAAVQLDSKQNMAPKNPKCQFCTELKRRGKKDLPRDVHCTQCLLVKHKDMKEFKENIPDNSMDPAKEIVTVDGKRLKRKFAGLTEKGMVLWRYKDESSDDEEPILPQEVENEPEEESASPEKSSSSSDYVQPMYFTVSSDSSTETLNDIAQLPLDEPEGNKIPESRIPVEEPPQASAIMVELPTNIFEPQIKYIEHSSDEDEKAKTIIFKDDWFDNKLSVRKYLQEKEKIVERSSRTPKVDPRDDEEELIFKLSLDEDDLKEVLTGAEGGDQVKPVVEKKVNEVLDFKWMMVNFENKEFEPLLEYPVKVDDLKDALEPYKK